MDILSAASMPWLDEMRGQLGQAHAAHRLPHSLLLVSMSGLGAEALARWVAALALCEKPQEGPCGTCASCQLLRSDSHPDIHLVRLEDKAQQIKIDQVRLLIEELNLKSYRGGYKVGVIEEAELLNVNAANAFLKTLEEPNPNSVLMLVVKPSHRLPATVASRCLRLALKPPAAPVARAWLQGQVAQANEATLSAALALAGGAPLLAAELAEPALDAFNADMHGALRALAQGSIDVTLLAEQWLRGDVALRVRWLENWITERIQAACGVSHSQQRAPPARLPAALLKAKIRALFELSDAVREFRRFASSGVNQQLALEALLLGARGALAN